MKLTKCDKCGKVSEPFKRTVSPGGWREIRFTVSYGGSKSFDVCPECIKKLGIPEDYTEGSKHIGDNLLDIIEEIAENVVEDRING